MKITFEITDLKEAFKFCEFFMKDKESKLDEERLKDKKYLKKLTEFNFSARAINAFEEEKIVTMGDLCRLSRYELSRIPNLGEKSIKEVMEILDFNNYCLSSKKSSYQWMMS